MVMVSLCTYVSVVEGDGDDPLCFVGWRYDPVWGLNEGWGAEETGRNEGYVTERFYLFPSVSGSVVLFSRKCYKMLEGSVVV